MKKNINKLVSKYSIANLTPYIVVMTGAITALDMFNIIPGIGEITPAALSGETWWNILFYPFNLQSSSGLSLIITLYIMWAFGAMLESHMGLERYNLYILTALVSITLGTIFLPIKIPAYFLELSIFLGCATVAGNMQILLFFIIPARMKWMGLIAGAFLTVMTISRCVQFSSLIPALEPLTGLLNYLLFFGIGTVNTIKQEASSKVRKQKFDVSTVTIHRCTVCGITEKDDPTMDFRYCVECSDHEYCSNHLHNHEHI